MIPVGPDKGSCSDFPTCTLYDVSFDAWHALSLLVITGPGVSVWHLLCGIFDSNFVLVRCDTSKYYVPGIMYEMSDTGTAVYYCIVVSPPETGFSRAVQGHTRSLHKSIRAHCYLLYTAVCTGIPLLIPLLRISCVPPSRRER